MERKGQVEVAPVSWGDPDTDGDGFTDPTEAMPGTDPNNPDTDGLTEARVRTLGTDPSNPLDD